MGADKIVGEYYDGVYYDIVEESTNNGVCYLLKLRKEQLDKEGNPVEANNSIPKVLRFSWEKAVMVLSNPWDKVTHYSDDNGEHYQCIVYDFIWIDIWAESIEELFNMIASMIHPDDAGIELLSDRINE